MSPEERQPGRQKRKRRRVPGQSARGHRLEQPSRDHAKRGPDNDHARKDPR